MLVRFQCLEKLRRAAWALLALLLLFAPALACARLASPAKEFCLCGPARSGTVAGVGDPGIGGLLATRQGGVVMHALSDLRGNVAGFVDASGAATFDAYYGAFGPLTAPTLNAPSFSTRWRDPTGFYYFGGRYYDPAVGRFLSPDPARFTDSRNLYAYCGNDPINGFDPDGLLQANPGHSSYDASLVDRVQYRPDPAYDGRYGYVARTQGGAAAAMLGLGDLLGVTTLYEAMTGRNLSSGQWMSGEEQRQSQWAAGFALAAMAIPALRGEGLVARSEASLGQRMISTELRSAVPALAAKTGPWASKDPLVGNLANKIEALYPGHVKGVNVPIYDATGKLVTDADILLNNAVLQIKSGGGKGLGGQLLRTQAASALPVIGYGPTLKPSVVTGAQKAGSLVTTSEELLLEIIKP